MKIGLVGYQGSGKSTLFGWLTGVSPDPAQAHAAQSAMATVRDPRVDQLVEIYKPKKITEAAIELVDTPGLARDHKGNAARLAMIRDCDCLIVVLAAFGGGDPAKDFGSFEEDLALADLEIIINRVARLEESIKKPRPDRDQQKEELAFLQRLQEHMEAGEPVSAMQITPPQEKAVRSFQLLSLKRRFAIVNTVDDEANPEHFNSLGSRSRETSGDEETSSQSRTLTSSATQVAAVPIGLEAELAQMAPDEAATFREELGVTDSYDRDALVRSIMDASGQMLFFTAGEKEVRTWMFHQGGTAVEAADSIHSDLARGFIRAETMTCADLIRLGSEREVKAAGLARNEMKDYVVQDGDVLNIKFSV